MSMREEARQQLMGSLIIGRCEQEPSILFQPNLCSRY